METVNFTTPESKPETMSYLACQYGGLTIS